MFNHNYHIDICDSILENNITTLDNGMIWLNICVNNFTLMEHILYYLRP